MIIICIPVLLGYHQHLVLPGFQHFPVCVCVWMKITVYGS